MAADQRSRHGLDKKWKGRKMVVEGVDDQGEAREDRREIKREAGFRKREKSFISRLFTFPIDRFWSTNPRANGYQQKQIGPISNHVDKMIDLKT